MIFLPYPNPDISDYLDVLRNGGTGFRCPGAPPVTAGRPGAPGRLPDRSLGPRLCPARRSLPAGEILPLAHTNGSPLRSVQTYVRFFSYSRGRGEENAAVVVFVLAATATATTTQFKDTIKSFC